MTKAWPKTPWNDAGQIFDFIGGAIEHDGTPDALSLAPGDYFDGLIASDKPGDAVFFVGHALPRYECVVWAAQTLLSTDAVDRNGPLVIAVLRWIDDPCEELRRAVARLADAEIVSSPAYLLAKAVFMSGGSISLPDFPPVVAPPDACAKFATGAVFDAATRSGNPSQVLRQAAEFGDAIASQEHQH